jgi:ubiquinone/menaquinone biosynthesis C-methylase UbiE
VTSHHVFNSVEESLNYNEWRILQYHYAIDLMPVSGFDGKVVLDYGCGPGHDLVGFATSSRPSRLIGMDVSPTSLAESEARMHLHGAKVELIRIRENNAELPLPDASVDFIHSAGVLHHTPDPERILREFRRIIKADGHAQIMVYNYDSLWIHLYVAYRHLLVEGRFAGKTLREAFIATTDGPGCPIAECYTASEFIALAKRAGFAATLRGCAISSLEMRMLARRWDALCDKRLPSESRRFLYDLTFDERGIPRHRGVVAGVSACYHLAPA